MIYLRRLFLLIMLLVLPLVGTWLVYLGTVGLLDYLQRYVDPTVLRFVTLSEFLAFFVICALDVRSRW